MTAERPISGNDLGIPMVPSNTLREAGEQPDGGYRALVAEALNARTAVSSVPEGVREEVTEGIAAVVDKYGRLLNQKWSRLTVSKFTRPHVPSGIEEVPDFYSLVEPIKNRLRDSGIKGKSPKGIVEGSFRDVIQMLQAKVTTMRELNTIRNRKYKPGGTDPVTPGREFRTRPNLPPNTVYISLRNLPQNRRR